MLQLQGEIGKSTITVKPFNTFLSDIEKRDKYWKNMHLNSMTNKIETIFHSTIAECPLSHVNMKLLLKVTLLGP